MDVNRCVDSALMHAWLQNCVKYFSNHMHDSFKNNTEKQTPLTQAKNALWDFDSITGKAATFH